MGTQPKKKVNWFETVNRRSRLRSATHPPIRSTSNPTSENIETILLDSDSDVEEHNPSPQPPPKASASVAAGQQQRSEVEVYEKESQYLERGEEAANLEKCPVTIEEVLEPQNDHPLPPNIINHAAERRPFTDPDYRFFLDNVTIDGTSYVFNTVVNGLPFTVRYEEEEYDTGQGEVIQAEPRSNSGRTKSQKDRRMNNDTQTPSAKKNKKQLYNATSSSEVVCEPFPPAEERILDESYQIFLKHVRELDGSMVLELENGVSVVYEKEHDKMKPREADVVIDGETKGNKPCRNPEKEVIVKEEPVDLYDDAEDTVMEFEFLNKEQKLCFSPLDLHTSTEVSIPYACQDAFLDESMAFNVSFDFKERLEAVTQQPFSQKDLDKLWKFANSHSPILKYKHLRHDSVPYSTNRLARSYLDLHPDLADKLVHAEDIERLRLLRGFHFWYQNLSHQGAFKPWESGSLQDCIHPSSTQ